MIYFNPGFKIHVCLPNLQLFWIFILFNISSTIDLIAQNTLRYLQPAKSWNEALPIGNGRIGAMIFGNSSNERIQLNDDSLWPDDLGWAEPPGTRTDLDSIRQLLFEGKHVEADQAFVEKFSNKTIVRSHQTMGDLFLDFKHDQVTEYQRTLDIKKSISTTSFLAEGHAIKMEVFASYPDQCIALHYSSDHPNGINGKIRMTRPADNGYPTANTRALNNHTLMMKGQVTQIGGKFRSQPAPIPTGVSFESLVFLQKIGGSSIAGPGYLQLNEVSSFTLYLVSNSSFYHEDYHRQNRIDSSQLTQFTYEELRERHVKDYQLLFNRVEISLGGEVESNIPTDQRLVNIRSGKIDRGLEALLFQYGRYLLISSSRPGTNPANLQGLWNQDIEAPWNADYHLNINLQMNYWPADVSNLGELNEPLFEYTDKLVENGQEVARINYGCNGAFIPHATDLWAPAWLRAPTAYWGCSVGAAGWMMQHYFDHFKFTRDTIFLRERVFPALEQVAQFYSDWLIRDPRDGKLISAPSTSPENRFIHPTGDTVATCLGSAMDQQVIREVFTNYIHTCRILKFQNELLDKVITQLSKLRPGFILGKDGRILEWDREYKELEPGHRHMSHLYGFHPGSEITQSDNPDIFSAVRTTLDYRLDHGGAGTGWSRAWLINCSARLLDGNMAHEHIQKLFQKSMFINLFDAHPPFQIDGNFGYTAGIAEMLIQSHEKNFIRLLPALPSAWEKGYIKGLKARGNYTLDLSWSEGELTQVQLQSKFGGSVNLNYKGQIKSVRLNPGETITIEY